MSSSPASWQTRPRSRTSQLNSAPAFPKPGSTFSSLMKRGPNARSPTPKSTPIERYDCSNDTNVPEDELVKSVKKPLRITSPDPANILLGRDSSAIMGTAPPKLAKLDKIPPLKRDSLVRGRRPSVTQAQEEKSAKAKREEAEIAKKIRASEAKNTKDTTKKNAKQPQRTIEQMVKSRDNKKRPRNETRDFDFDDDELAMFDIGEDSSVTNSQDSTARLRNNLDDTEKQITRKGKQLKKRATEIKNLAEKEDDFMSALRSTTVWKPSKAGLGQDIDLDISLSLNSRDDLEEFDETLNMRKQTAIVDEKYKDTPYPGSLSLEEIRDKASTHTDCVPAILNADISSYYYAKASTITKTSTSLTASNAEFNQIQLSNFTIGYYGLKRQAAISQLINREYQEEIQHSLLRNKTVQWWSKESFVMYVLSAEVGARMAAEELSIDLESVYDLFLDTVDYGKYITDLVPLY